MNRRVNNDRAHIDLSLLEVLDAVLHRTQHWPCGSAPRRFAAGRKQRGARSRGLRLLLGGSSCSSAVPVALNSLELVNLIAPAIHRSLSENP